jgi:hypothetical protein
MQDLLANYGIMGAPKTGAPTQTAYSGMDWFWENMMSNQGGIKSAPLTDYKHPDVSSKLNTSPQIGFKLDMKSNITLNIDGRTVWNAIKPYARADLLNTENTSGGAARSVSVTI